MNSISNQPSIKKRTSLGRSTLARSKEETLKYSKDTRVQNQLGLTLKDGQAVNFLGRHRENHTHIIGGTGTGKSKFLELLLRQDIKNKNAGFCLIDPHGSLYEEILIYASHYYPRLADRVVLFNPAQERENIIGFNPIPEGFEQLDYILDMLISGCLKAWGQDNTDRTPRITKWLENIFYPLIVNNLTLVESVPFISLSKESKAQRSMLLSTVNNPTVRDDWMMFDSSTNTQKQNLIEGASNRLRKFLRNEIIRNILGQQKHSLDLEQIIAENKILLVNLNGAGKISHENSQLLGIMLVNEIFRVAKLRDPRDPDLKPFYFYIDEFAQFVTRDIARALEETRKFKMFMVLAHQHLAQLKKEDEYLYASVMTNCKNKVVFGSLSKEDADIMTDEVWTGFFDLLSIKDQVASTKVRHHEETRIVRGKTTSQGRSSSHSSSTSFSEGYSRSDTTGESESYGETTGEAESKGVSQSKSRAKTWAKGISESISKGTTWAKSISRSRSQSENWSENWSTGQSHQDTNSSTVFSSGGKSRASGSASGSNSQVGGNRGGSVTDTEGEGSSQGGSENKSQGKTENHGGSVTKTTGKTESLTHSRSTTRTEGTSQSETIGYSSSEGEGKSETTGESESWGTTEQEVPFLRPEEYKEVTNRTFWSKDELHYQRMAELKNQDTGKAVIRIGAEKPVQVQIENVKPVFYSPRSSPKKIERFRERVFEANTNYYLPLNQARLAYQERQMAVFGEPLPFEESHVMRVEAIDVTPTENESKPNVENPFE